MLELIINSEQDKKSIMLVENGVLIEKHEENDTHKRIEGNIYCGVVQTILEGMQAAFINIGDEKNTFIRVKDAIPKQDESKQETVEKSNINIIDVLKENSKILIQVKRDGTQKKGARVSTHINLPGRFVVFLPNSNFVTVSQKIEDEKRKNELVNLVKQVLPKNTGAIIRTSALNADNNKILEDLKSLLEEWNKIELEYKNTSLKAPQLLYDNKALLRRTLIDIVDQGLNKVIVNDIKTYEDVKSILQKMNMQDNIKVDLKEKENLLKIYELEEQISKTNNRKIWLKCGGFITIDKTEALTAIDVNTGKFIGTNNLEETVFKVNSEATKEIAKQLRLRDVGGIIIIDYIDMQEEENKVKITNLLENELKKDRSKTQIFGFTNLNLLELTRKNMCNNDEV